MTTEQIFEAVCAQIQSESIRTWAKTEKNKPLILAYIATAIETGRAKHRDYPRDLATWLICEAMGL